MSGLKENGGSADAAIDQQTQINLERLVDLERTVIELYQREADSSSHYERSSSASTLSVKDLDLKKGRQSSRHSIILLEVLQEWRNLVTTMKNERAFLAYVSNLLVAFRDLPSLDTRLYQHMKTLVKLLTNTVKNRHRDGSTECRFVTLLEVVLSYGKDWRPSEEVSLFWVRLMQRLDIDIPPVNFRRKAYRILVSLSWVPSSKGLLEACSFEANRQMIDPEKSPPRVKMQLQKIRDKPQPRYDCVNQLLDRLKDETGVCVAITSERGGMGKTTLAALVASHPSILRVFKIMWISFSDHDKDGINSKRLKAMSYDTYKKYLDDMCSQMSISLEWPPTVKRFEEEALRLIREKSCMYDAKEMFANALSQKEDNFLLILDNVTDASMIEWFRFNKQQSTIVTTPHNNMEGVDWTVDLAPMSEEEAIELFLSEASFPVTHVLGLTSEIRKVVACCDYHPLTVRTVGRWYKLKVVTAGFVSGMEELLQDMASLESLDEEIEQKVNGDKDYDASNLFDFLSLMLGPPRLEGQGRTSILFVLCIASMAVVFPNRAPLDSVLLLWEQLLKVESHAIDEMSMAHDPTPTEIRKHAFLIAEGLAHMGFVLVTEREGDPWVEIYHDMYREFAMYMAEEMDVAESFELTAEQWNRAFVTAYFKQRIEGLEEGGNDNSWEYSIENLPSHIFQAKMFPMAETILGEENFFRARIEAMGWDRAVDVHIADCVHLQLALEKSAGGKCTVSLVFDQTARIIATQAEGSLESSEESFVVQVSRALYKMGVALAENGYYTEAVAQFDSAQNLLPQSQELRASILYGAGWALLAANLSEKALKKIKASRKVMEEYVTDHVLYKEALQLQGEALVGEGEYKEASEFFEGTISALKMTSSANKIELGTTLHKTGRLYMMMGELEKAKSILNECKNWKLDIAENSMDLSSVYSLLGDICIEGRNHSEARGHYEKALSVLDSLRTSPEHVDYLLVVGKLRFLQSEFVGSFQAFATARALISDSPKLFMDKSAYDLRCISKRYKTKGEIDTALSLLNDSLVLTEESPFSLERSAGLHELASCLIEKDEVDEALVCLEQSLEIRIMKLGECVQVLDTLNAIGNVHMSLGAYDEALAIFDKVNELTNRICPDDVERIAGVLYSIGEVYDAKTDYTEAIEKFDECMNVLKRDRSSDHPHVAKALQRLGDVTASQKDLDVAYDYYCEALRIRQMHSDERLLAETLHSIGVLTRKRKNIEAAREPLLHALEIRRKLDVHRETGETLLEIGNIFRLQSDIENAISLYEKGLEILDEKDDITGSVHLAMGHAQLWLKKDAEAIASYQRAREIRLLAYGRDSMKTGNVSRSLGLAKYLSNQADDALIQLNEFIRVVELNDEDEHEEEGDDLDYVLAVILMFDIHRAAGREEQAQNLIEVAKEVCEESDELKEQFPQLIGMVDRRVELPKEAPKSGGGLLARLNLSDETATRLSIDKEEEALLRTIPFVDD